MTPTKPTPYGSVPAALAFPGVARSSLTASRAAPLFSYSLDVQAAFKGDRSRRGADADVTSGETACAAGPAANGPASSSCAGRATGGAANAWCDCKGMPGVGPGSFFRGLADARRGAAFYPGLIQ